MSCLLPRPNQLETIPEPLRDRMEIIPLDGYTEHESPLPAAYLVPRQRQAHGLRPEELPSRTRRCSKLLVTTLGAGVRNSERRIGAICRKVAVQITSREAEQIEVTPGRVLEYLKHEPFVSSCTNASASQALPQGFAVTVIHDILYIEVTRMQGKGNLTLTDTLVTSCVRAPRLPTAMCVPRHLSWA